MSARITPHVKIKYVQNFEVNGTWTNPGGVLNVLATLSPAVSNNADGNNFVSGRTTVANTSIAIHAPGSQNSPTAYIQAYGPVIVAAPFDTLNGNLTISIGSGSAENGRVTIAWEI